MIRHIALVCHDSGLCSKLSWPLPRQDRHFGKPYSLSRKAHLYEGTLPQLLYKLMRKRSSAAALTAALCCQYACTHSSTSQVVCMALARNEGHLAGPLCRGFSVLMSTAALGCQCASVRWRACLVLCVLGTAAKDESADRYILDGTKFPFLRMPETQSTSRNTF